MKLVLDTHIFLWWDSQPDLLTRDVIKAIGSGENEVFLSVASVWEMVIKFQVGKIAFRRPLRELVFGQVENGIQILDVTLEHVFQVQKLPAIHKDPFDRLIIAQAIAEGARVVTCDRIFESYPVEILQS